MKKKIILLSVILLLLFLLCYPAEALAAARNGLKLWLETLLPTLLPFMILTGILVHTDWITKILQPTAPFFKVVFGLSPGGAYVFLLGLLTGYPMGAKLTADLYYAGKISRQEAEYLLTFCNNPSPAFLITYVGHICLEGKLHIGFLVGILFLSDMICMCFFRFTFYRKNSLLSFCTPKTSEQEYTSAGLLDFVIMNSFETMAKLGGLYSYVFYSVRSHKSFLVSSGTGKIYSSRTDRSYHWSPWAPAVRVFLFPSCTSCTVYECIRRILYYGANKKRTWKGTLPSSVRFCQMYECSSYCCSHTYILINMIPAHIKHL